MKKPFAYKKRCAVFFDSGIGGLNLLRECVRRVPRLNYIYCADNYNVPYGNRSAEEIYSLTKEALKGIEEYEPLALVVACNTVTANCISLLRRDYSFPVVGIQPAIKQAAEYGDKCLVLATGATVKSPPFNSLVARYAGDGATIRPCDRLAGFVEDNVFNLPVMLPKGLLPEEEADCVVLGCTHYVFVKDQIARHYNCPVFDGISGTADHFAKILGTADHFNTFLGIFDHNTKNRTNPTFFKGNINKNKAIFDLITNNKE